MGDVLHSLIQYELLGRIAKGGMAEVYLCRAKGAGRYQKLLVIKKIRSDFADSRDFVEMFMDEAAISAQLQHRGIGQVFDFGRVNNTYIIAMEYIHGVSLRDILQVHDRLGEPPPVAMASYLLSEVCGALHHAHTKDDWHGQPLGIIHRDVNPRNVMVTLDGEVKLIDFGIAKAAQRNYMTMGGIKGKISYMSPEQAAGAEVDHRSDIFSAGAILFELLTGRKLFDGDNDISILKRVERAEVPRPATLSPGVDPRLEAICLRALSRDREARPSSAREMQAALETVWYAEGYSSWQLGRWMKEHFAERLDRVSALLRGRAANTPSPQELAPMEPTDIFLTAGDLEGEGPTHFFIGPEEAGDGPVAERPTEVRLAPSDGDETIVDNSAVHFTAARPAAPLPVRAGALVALVILAACVASGLTFYLASRGGPDLAPAAQVPPPALAPAPARAAVPDPEPDFGAPDLPPLEPEVILLPDAGKRRVQPRPGSDRARRRPPRVKRRNAPPKKKTKKKRKKEAPLPY